MIRPAWLRRPELVKCQHWQSMRREKHVPVLNKQLLKKETPQNVGTQNRKEKGAWTSGREPGRGDSTASLRWLERCSRAHITSLTSPQRWAGIIGGPPNSKSKIITHAFSPQAHLDYAAAPNHRYHPPQDEVNREREWLCLVSYWKKFPQVSRKKGHSLFTLLC